MPPSTQNQQNAPQPFPHKGLIVLAILGLAAILGLGSWQWYLQDRLAEESHADFYTDLAERNSSFAQAEALSLQGGFTEALPLYAKALQEVTTDDERVQVMLLEARAQASSGNYTAAIPRLKAVIAMQNTATIARARALAVETLASIYARGDVALNREIFKDDPFKSFWVEGDPALTLRRLHEYAASIYPVAPALYNISFWYSSKILLTGAGAPTQQEATEYLAKAKENIGSADTDLAFMRADGTMIADTRAALVQRALVLGNLERHGDTSFGSADAAFGEALNAFRDAPSGQDGQARYYYALFLAQTGGAAKKNEISAVLAPLATPAYADSPVRGLLQNARTVAFYRQFPALIASIDPGFKAYLMTLGWTEADFSS